MELAVLAWTSDGSRVYATNALSNSVSVIDVALNTIVANVAVGVLLLSIGHFIVLLNPAVFIERLIEDVLAIDFPGTAGQTQLKTALEELAAGNVSGAVLALEDFVAWVSSQRGKKIPEAESDAFTEHALALIDLIA